jgi:hypothetical protein
MSLQSSDLISSAEVRALLGNISVKTLGRYRLKYWMVGVHFVQPVQKVMYVKPMILDWILNGRIDPEAHNQAIQMWVAENQPQEKNKARKKFR